MANIKISALPTTGTLLSTHIFPFVDTASNTTKTATAQVLLNYITGSTFTGLTLNSSSVIDVSTANSALRITQRGTGESIRVEDQTNPDATPFVVDAAGNVGIGTSTPSTFLNVTGNWTNPDLGTVRIDGNNPILNIVDNDATARYSSVALGNAGGTWIVSNGVSTGSTDSDFYINRTFHNGSDRRFRFARDSGGGLGIINSTNQHESIFLYPAGNSYFLSGNVGIGTNNPQAKLHISGAAEMIRMTTTAATGSNYMYFYNTSSAPVQGYIGYGSPSDDDFEIFNARTASIDFYTNSLRRMTISSSGDVGIGTNTPLTQLDVRSGVITAGSNTSVAASEILRGYYTAGATTVIGSENSSGGPVIGYAVKPGLTADTFSSSAGINVGRSAYTINGSSHKWYYGAVQNIAENSAVVMNEAMRIDASGRLGIGTNQPVQTLSVTGTLGVSGATTISTISGTQAQFTGLTGTYTAPLGTVSLPSYTFVGDPNTGIYSPAADTLVFVEGGTEVLRISSNTAITASGPLTGSTASFTTITGSIVTGSTALFTAVTASTGMFINNGNLIFGTTGRGIDFSITPNSGTTTPAELFDDYEEGTWSPSLSGTTTAGTFTYNTNTTGSYTKVGNLVNISCYLQVNSTTAALTGTININGLPFLVQNQTYSACPAGVGYYVTNTPLGSLSFIPIQNTSRINLYRTVGSSSSLNQLLTGSAANELGNTPIFQFSGIYFTDQ